MSEPAAYERDPRLTHLDTEVVERRTADGERYVVLADTVLFPEGGGQPSDRGTVGGVPVLDVQRVDGTVLHRMAGEVQGTAVSVELDWDRRFDHMQQHTAQHLLTAIAADRFGWATTAFHLGARTCDVELDVARLTEADLGRLEEAVAIEVRVARPVSARRVTREEYEALPVRSRGLPADHVGDVRLVEIHGIDLNTCGGTHCSSTAELEAVKLLGTESMRGGTRVFFVAGARLRSRLGVEHARTAALRALLGASDDELVPAVAARLDQLREAGRAQRALEDALAEAVAARLAAEAGPVLFERLAGRDLAFLQKVARRLVELAPAHAALLASGNEEGVFLLAAGPDSSVDVPALGPEIAGVLEGTGGGRGPLFQGRATRLSRLDEARRVLGI